MTLERHTYATGLIKPVTALAGATTGMIELVTASAAATGFAQSGESTLRGTAHCEVRQ